MTAFGFDSIIGQQRPIELLQTFLQKAALPHALIFSGISGIGKKTVAKSVAMALNCQTSTDRTNPCGQCSSCQRIFSGNHPDLLLIEPQGNYLRIDQIRRLLGTLSMKPYVAQHRVVIIANAQAMNQEAANALLKVLEEPPSNTILILTVVQKSDLLPTIVSRCRHIGFQPMTSKNIVTILLQTEGIDKTFVHTAAAMSHGSLTKAKQLATTFWQQQRDWVIQATGLGQPKASQQRCLASYLAFSAQLAQKKDHLTDLLEILKTWIRDLSIWPYSPQSVINTDYRDTMEQVRSELDDNHLLHLWQAVEKAQKDIDRKANIRLTLDVMALTLAGHRPACGPFADGRFT